MSISRRNKFCVIPLPPIPQSSYYIFCSNFLLARNGVSISSFISNGPLASQLISIFNQLPRYHIYSILYPFYIIILLIEDLSSMADDACLKSSLYQLFGSFTSFQKVLQSNEPILFKYSFVRCIPEHICINKY